MPTPTAAPLIAAIDGLRAARLVDEAHLQVEKERAEVDAYIDSRLATLEVILNKTLDAVNRGRERLAGASDKDVLAQLADE